MTKAEYDYKRIEKQMIALKEKLDAKKEQIDKERDEIVIKAIRAKNITREQGMVLAKLIKDDKSFEAIMKLDPEIKKNVCQSKSGKENESEDKEDEE